MPFAMTTRALVLGGGGPVGIAWEAGLVAGLEQEGVCLADAGLIVGTSAGAVIGSQLSLGRPPGELVAVQRALGSSARAAGKAPRVDMSALVESFRTWLTADRTSPEVLAEIGAFALNSKTMSEEEALAGFGSMNLLGSDAWPEQPFVCTAIDAANGTFVAWDKHAGVPLGLAVASSCAVPGIFPPVTINGRRYIDGGMRSTTNSDLARGYDAVLVVSVTAPLTGRSPVMRRRFEEEIAGLRKESRVEVVLPDGASLEAFGPNLLDASRRGVVLDAGLRQGLAEAQRLRAFWG
jgi:NTE family protein